MCIVMEWLAILATVFGIVNGGSAIPQAIKIFVRKSAKDISIISFSMAFVGVFVWLLYGIQLGNVPIMISNSVATLSVGAVLIGWFWYGRGK